MPQSNTPEPAPGSGARAPFSRKSLAAQAMGHIDPATRAVVMPLHLSTTFIRDSGNARGTPIRAERHASVASRIRGAEAGSRAL